MANSVLPPGGPEASGQSIVDYLLTPEVEAGRRRWKLQFTMTRQQLKPLLALLDSYPDIFSKDEEDIGCYNAWKYTIDTGNHAPVVFKPPILWFFDGLGSLERRLFLDNNPYLRPSQSAWSSRTYTALDHQGLSRLGTDFALLNGITQPGPFPLARVGEHTQQGLLQAKYFSILHVTMGTHQIQLSEESKAKTAFTTPLGRYEWQTTHPGLRYASAAFQEALKPVLEGVRHCTEVFKDDIVIFNIDYGEQLATLASIFRQLRKYNLKIYPPRCLYFRTEYSQLAVYRDLYMPQRPEVHGP